jgi:hypothetical protein
LKNVKFRKNFSPCCTPEGRTCSIILAFYASQEGIPGSDSTPERRNVLSVVCPSSSLVLLSEFALQYWYARSFLL